MMLAVRKSHRVLKRAEGEGSVGEQSARAWSVQKQSSWEKTSAILKIGEIRTIRNKDESNPSIRRKWNRHRRRRKERWNRHVFGIPQRLENSSEWGRKSMWDRQKRLAT